MKQIFRRLDFGLLLVTGLSLFTLIPLLGNPAGLPNGSDVLYHTYRVAEMDRSWLHGALLPRWAEGLYFGYGSPLFHYYASLTYYITSIFIRLFGLHPLGALRLLIVVCMISNGIGMYLFTKQQLGRLAGVFAGVAYVYAPYLVFTEPYARGAYPELLAFTVFPFVMWRFSAFIRTPNAVRFMLASVALFLLIITHNLMALTLTGLLGAWLVWQLIIHLRFGWSVIEIHLASLAALILGVGLAGYFWVPVLLESQAVNLENLTGVALLDYRNFFVKPAELLRFPALHDAGAINGLDPALSLGLAQWVLPLIGIVGVLLVARKFGFRTYWFVLSSILFFSVIALLLIFLMLPFAASIWDALSVLAYLQFPWRLLGPVAFCLAFLVGMNAVWIQEIPERIAIVPITLIVAFPILGVLPLFYVPEWRNTEVDTSISAYHAAEIAGLQLGTTFTDEYRPHDVFTLPGETTSLLEDYADGYSINKANEARLPEGSTLELIFNNPESHEWHVDAVESFDMEVYNFYWLGWQATIDNIPVEITPSPDHGLITFTVPAGEHQIRLFLGSTPARDLGNMISLGSLLLMIIIAIWVYRYISKDYPPPPERLTRLQVMAILGGGVITLIIVVILFREGTMWLASSPGTSPAENEVLFNLDDEFSVIGYDLNSREFYPGDEVLLNVYWYPRETTDVNFSSFVHISNGGPPVAQADKLHPAGRAIPEWWTPDGYIFDEYAIALPSDMTPGEYQLSVGLYTCEFMPPGECGNGYRPTVTDEDGEILGDAVNLGTITVR